MKWRIGFIEGIGSPLLYLLNLINGIVMENKKRVKFPNFQIFNLIDQLPLS